MVVEPQLTSDYTTTLSLDSRPSSSSNETSHRDSEIGEAGEVIGVENIDGLASGQNEVGGCEGVRTPGATAECGGAEVESDAVAGGCAFVNVPASGTTSTASSTLVGSDVTSSDAVIACEVLRSTPIRTTASPHDGTATSTVTSGRDFGGGAVSMAISVSDRVSSSQYDPVISGSSYNLGLGSGSPLPAITSSEVALISVSPVHSGAQDDDIMMIEPCGGCGDPSHLSCSQLTDLEDSGWAANPIPDVMVGERVGADGDLVQMA